LDIKIALCYYGYAFNMGNTKNTTANDTAVNYNATYSNHKNKLIDPNNMDIFIHSWSKQDEDSITETYKPIDSILETQIDFTEEADKIYYNTADRMHKYRTHVLSRWYSTQKVMELKSKYEKENNFKYDLVMLSRFDVIYDGNWNIHTLDNSKFYIMDKWFGDYNNVLPDLWFIGNSSDMDKFANLYENTNNIFHRTDLDNEGIYWGAHHLPRRQLIDTGVYDNIERCKLNNSTTVKRG
jgi:hypothetical protein